MIIQAKVRKLERFYILIIFNQVQTNFKSPYLLLYMPYYHISVRRDTISLFLPLTILMSSVILKTVYHETVLIRYLTIVKLRSHY